MLNVLQNLHGVIFSIEYLGHDLHVAFRYALFVPKFLEISKSLIDGFLLPLLTFPHIGLVPHLVCINEDGLLSREAS